MAKYRTTRLWFVLSFPLIVAAIWFSLAAIAEYERNQLVDQLTNQLTSGNVRGSLSAVRQLALTPHALLEPIVAAATSTDRNLAGGAQLAITDLLEEWQQQLDAGRHGRLIVDGLNELAAALDAHRDAFSPADRPWITRTVGQLVRLANRVTPAGLELTTHCESLLTTAGQRRAPTRTANSRLPLPADSRAEQIAARDDGHRTIPQPAPGDARELADVTPLREFTASPDAESAFSPPSASAYQSITAPTTATATQLSSDPQAPIDTPARSTNDDHARRGWASTESGKVYPEHDRQGAPAIETGAQNSKAGDASANALKSVGSRALLQQWLSASETNRSPFEQELVRRGFGKLNAKLVQVLFSDRSEDRVRLVQDLMAEPGVNTVAWLAVLTEDPDAEVRLAAVTMMGTSTDPQLAEQAYQAALHDRDPRVADLAARLRDRRDNVQRR